jgi:hypothetical protein
MKISKELRERIRRLEEEQHKQSEDLQELSDLRDMVAVAELEQELANIANEVADSTGKKTAAQTDKDMNIALEQQKLAAAAKGLKVKTQATKTNKDIDLSKELLGAARKAAGVRSGYVICLLFNEAAPTEWAEEAGGGWRGQGLGTAYANQVEARRRLEELKRKWPTYPIEVRPIKK